MAVALSLLCPMVHAALAQEPQEPVDPSPLDGETYYFVNQMSGMEIDAGAKSGDAVVQAASSFTSLSQRWAVTKLADGNWKISSLVNGLCLDGAATAIAQNPCAVNAGSQEWSFRYVSNGYNAVVNVGSGDALDVTGASTSTGASLDQTALGSSATQSQLWLFRPVFFRGNDNALLEKQEEDRVAGGYPWWQDAGQTGDVLKIMKDHGLNLVRIRPTSAPPYQTYTLGVANAIPATCSANGCYAETDAASLDLAKRAKQLGMSVELSLLFDGGSSVASPGAWSGYTVSQTQTAIYNYVKTEIESFRIAGAMPDIVAVGNEVDTGFLGSLDGSPSGAANSTAFENFATYETAGLQAVSDAASDTSVGAAIPAPIRCIHITPAWDLTSFFGEVNTDNVPYDAMCQSYYPIFHGPLTAAQAAASNPNSKPVEQTALTNAANAIGKPIFLMEIGEHYESGFQANDPWYQPTPAGQRQFVLDVEAVLKGLPNNLGMGFDYWDGEGTNIPNKSGFTAGDGQTDATFVWNGLTLFDNADTSGSTNVSAANYNAVLPAMNAMGGRLDASLAYKLVNAADGSILEVTAGSTATGAALDTATDTGIVALSQQWQISSTGDGYLQIASLNSATPVNVLDTQGATAEGSAIVQAAASPGTASQEWDLVTAGGGNVTLVNKASGLLLTAVAGSGAADSIQQQAAVSSNADWITAKSANQIWKIVPAHITAATTPKSADFAVSLSPSSATIASGSSAVSTITLTPQGGFSAAITFGCSGLPAYASCTFSPSSVTPNGAAATVALMLSTDVAAASASPGRRPGSAAALGGGRGGTLTAAMAALLAPWIFLRRRRRAWLVVCGVAVLFVASCGFMLGCSSGSAASTPPSKTPAGQSSVTITATSGALSHTAIFQLTVQ
jgi:arabinogalactan endo-1,4-beta-galactosidase